LVLVALTPAGDLFISAKDLLIRAKHLFVAASNGWGFTEQN
jgi:hypothetical protein